jgi:DNA-binding CsgD family transcriptional regulator
LPAASAAPTSPRATTQQLIASITQRLWPMGDDTVFIPGHGPESTFGRERKDQPLRRHEIARARFLRNVNGRIAGLSVDQTEELQRGVRWAARGRRQMLTLRNGGKTLSVACVPLSEPFEGQQGSVLLMLARQTGTQNLAVTFFAQTHGLTPAEEGVLRALCDGMDVQEVAAHNGVSESTVRTQVRSLREKTQSTSIRQLVQQVAALPPVVPISLALPAQPGPQLAA